MISVWAIRDLLCRPLESTALAATIYLLTFWIGTVILFSTALGETAAQLLQKAPSLVLRKVGPGGWAPLPTDESVAKIRAVVGVTHCQTRIWGAARLSGQPVTVAAYGADTSADLALPALEKHQAYLGAGLKPLVSGKKAVLDGQTQRSIQIAAFLPAADVLASADIVLLHPDTAREVLGLAPNQATDLVVDVFHPAEAQALKAELAEALGYRVAAVTREELIAQYQTGALRMGGIGMFTWLPAMLAAVFLSAAVVRERVGRHSEIGLLKTLGWCSPDIVALQLMRAAVIALPTVSLGLATAYAAVFVFPNGWLAHLFLGAALLPAGFQLTTTGALGGSLLVAVAILAPYLGAVWMTSAWAAGIEPQALLEKDRFS